MNASSEGFEIDFLPVGEGDRSGDAIAVRYRADGKESIMVYDGGTQNSGERLVEHIRTHYNSNHVDFVVNSHPDNDHASGLSVVLENMTVGAVWMHRPWEYSTQISHYFKDKRITDQSLAQRFKDKMSAAYALEELAVRKRVPMYEPYQGSQIGKFLVISPERNWYLHELVPAFAKTPEVKAPLTTLKSLFGGQLQRAAEGLKAYLDEHWHIESLREDVETSAENESSAVLVSDIGGKRILLTGDAGTQALHRSANYVESLGHTLTTTNFIQVPHHGSRHNVSTSSLDRVVGQRVAQGNRSKIAFISAGKESTTHPRKMVVNAFIRRGATTIATQGQSKRWAHQYPDRQGWSAAVPLDFSNRVESWDN